MEMPTSKSPGNTTTHSQTLSFDNRNNVLRDASFSSYLNKAEENFLLKLTQEINSPTCTMSPKAGHHLRVGRVLKDVEDEEIGVFGAEKYFQGEISEETLAKPKKEFLNGPKYHLHEKDCSTAHIKSTQSSPSYLVSANMCSANDQKELQGALSVRSESSLNSRSALLHRIPRNQARGSDMNKGGNVKRFLASLGCHCNDKTSVEVDEQEQLAEKSADFREMAKPPLETGDFIPKTKSLSSSTYAEDGNIHRHLKWEDCFSFPVLGSSNPGNIAVKNDQLQEREKEKAPLSLEKKLSMLTNHWNVVIPREEEIEIPSNGMHNDAASDASSDLFEIESFSTNGNSVLARQALDGNMSRCASPRNCYAPSEASIEWSVVTANAADISTFSDYESIRGNPRNLDSMVRNAKIGKPAKDMQIKRRHGILSGCKSHKAVRVVENGYKTGGGQNVTSSGQERQHGYRGPVMPADTRFRAETATKLTRHHTFDMCSLPWSHSQHLLYSR